REVRAYATALAGLSGAADEIEAVRAELRRDAEPAVDQARDALLAACAPFGIEDPMLAVNMVRHQVGLGLTARLQRELEAAVPDAAEEPDIDELRSRRQQTAKEYDAAYAAVPDIEHLADRRSAVERRVTVLEAAMGESTAAAALADTGDIERYLLARLTSVRN